MLNFLFEQVISMIGLFFGNLFARWVSRQPEGRPIEKRGEFGSHDQANQNRHEKDSDKTSSYF